MMQNIHIQKRGRFFVATFFCTFTMCFFVFSVHFVFAQTALDFSLSLGSTQGVIQVADSPTVMSTANAVLISGTNDIVTLSYAVSPNPSAGGVVVDFSPLGSLLPVSSAISFDALPGTPPDTYLVTIFAYSGVTVRSVVYRLIVGTDFDFIVTPTPSLGNITSPPGSVGPIVITAQNISSQNQASTNNISFSAVLPTGITIPAGIVDCTIPAVVSGICTSSVVFVVDGTAALQVHTIPITGTVGSLIRTMFFNLTVGPAVTNIAGPSPNFLTDTHQRPRIYNAKQFTQTPISPFVGDDVTFDGSPATIHDSVLSVGGLADQPIDVTGGGINASVLWDFGGAGLPSTDLSPSITLDGSGQFSVTFIATDTSGLNCYTAGATSIINTEPCQCSLTKPAGSGGLNVSKPKPFFREVRP